MFYQQDREVKLVGDARDIISGGLNKLIESASNSTAKWKIIVVAVTGHGFINYPHKESCVAMHGTDESEQTVLRFINLE